MSYEKLPAITGSVACPICGCGAHNFLSMGALLAVGFGDVSVTKDGTHVYSENDVNQKKRTQDNGWDDFWTGQTAEDEAAKDPDHDWRAHFYAPLYESHYQRQGDKHWVLYEKGEGFA